MNQADHYTATIHQGDFRVLTKAMESTGSDSAKLALLKQALAGIKLICYLRLEDPPECNENHVCKENVKLTSLCLVHVVDTGLRSLLRRLQSGDDALVAICTGCIERARPRDDVRGYDGPQEPFTLPRSTVRSVEIQPPQTSRRTLHDQSLRAGREILV